MKENWAMGAYKEITNHDGLLGRINAYESVIRLDYDSLMLVLQDD